MAIQLELYNVGDSEIYLLVCCIDGNTVLFNDKRHSMMF
jgi:hypothetical protein